MAEANFNEFVAGGASSARSGSTVNVIGAVTSLALLAAAATWGYKLAVRDASGVPVIMAIEGPIRVAPEEPGGRIAANTGLTVMQIAGTGSAGEVPDQIVLAAPPVELAEDDAAGIGSAAPQEVVESETFARTLALAEELARQAAAEFTEDDALAPSGAFTGEVADLPEGAMRTSLRPMPRPQARAAEAAFAAAEPEVVLSGTVAVSSNPSVGAELDPSSLPVGSRLAQIGAFDDMEGARAEWDRIASRHGALFDGKNRVIQPASSVGRTFYRLRVAGFTSEDESRRFCAAIESGDLRCVPVTQR